MGGFSVLEWLQSPLWLMTSPIIDARERGIMDTIDGCPRIENIANPLGHRLLEIKRSTTLPSIGLLMRQESPSRKGLQVRHRRSSNPIAREMISSMTSLLPANIRLTRASV